MCLTIIIQHTVRKSYTVYLNISTSYHKLTNMTRAHSVTSQLRDFWHFRPYTKLQVFLHEASGVLLTRSELWWSSLSEEKRRRLGSHQATCTASHLTDFSLTELELAPNWRLLLASCCARCSLIGPRSSSCDAHWSDAANGCNVSFMTPANSPVAGVWLRRILLEKHKLIYLLCRLKWIILFLFLFLVQVIFPRISACFLAIIFYFEESFKKKSVSR